MKLRASPQSGPPTRARLATATAAVALLAAACGSADSTESAEAADGNGDGQSESASDNGPRLDPSQLSGEAQTISGETFDLGELAGKDLVLWFWAPW